MHVALVSLRHDAGWDTPERFIAGDATRRGLAGALVEAGHAVTVVVEADFDAVVDGPVRWRFVRPDRSVRATRRALAAAGERWPAIRLPAPHLVRAARAARPDVVHAFDLVNYPHLIGLAGAGAPMVAHFHGGAAARRPPWRALERRALAGVDRLLFTTVEQAAPWVANGYPAERVRAVVETSVALTPAPRPPLDPARPRLLCAGRLDPVKDPMTTLAGFALLLGTHPGATLELCWTDAPLLDAVARRARALGPAVRLLGRLAPEAVHARMAAADVLVQASVREVCGVAVLEAMALGLPPVVTDIPAFRAVLGDCGARFPVGDAAGLAAGVRAVLGQPDAGARCVERFRAALSFTAMARAAERVYAEL